MKSKHFLLVILLGPILIVLLFLIAAHSQEKKPDPPKATLPADGLRVPDSEQGKLLQQQHRLDVLKAQRDAIQTNWLQSQAYAQLQETQKSYQEANAKLQAAQAEQDKHVTDVAKGLGVDGSKAEFDADSLKIVPKKEVQGEPGPQTPRPEKK